jgi:hypothetical protein
VAVRSCPASRAMSSTRTSFAERMDTKVCRISRGTQSSPSFAFLVIAPKRADHVGGTIPRERPWMTAAALLVRSGTHLGAPRGAVVPDGGERPSISLPSQRWGEAGGSLIRGSPGRVGAASTKSRRSGTAGWAGRGERDGKVYERNRLRYASSRAASSNPADPGWYAVRTCLS